MKSNKEICDKDKFSNINKEICDKLITESKTIDIQKVSEEVLTWVTNNVEYFIDNKTKTFKLDLIVDSDAMPETKKLQSLYKLIPDETLASLKVIGKCKGELDNVTEEIYFNMKKQKALLEKLFERMIYFYEVVALDNGVPLEKKLVGAVDIMQFEYEAFSVGVKISAPVYEITDGETGERKMMTGEDKEYEIPEGFAVWLEIAYKDAVANASMF